MLVRRPARPVAGHRAREAGEDAPGLHVVADDDVEVARGRVAAGAELERGVLCHVRVANDLQRVVALDLGRRTRPDRLRVGRHLDGAAARHVDGVVQADGVAAPLTVTVQVPPMQSSAVSRPSVSNAALGRSASQQDAAVVQVREIAVRGRNGDFSPAMRCGARKNEFISGRAKIPAWQMVSTPGVFNRQATPAREPCRAPRRHPWRHVGCDLSTRVRIGLGVVGRGWMLGWLRPTAVR